MNIYISQKPSAAADNSYDSFNYYLNTKIHIPESADSTEVMCAIFKAMQIEGYHIESIANSMYNYAKYLAFENNFELKDDDEKEENY